MMITLGIGLTAYGPLLTDQSWTQRLKISAAGLTITIIGTLLLIHLWTHVN